VSHLVLPGARPEQVAADIARLVDRLLPAPADPPESRPSPVPSASPEVPL
jgi:hypothetical protein